MTKRQVRDRECISSAIDGKSIGEAITILEEMKAKHGNDAWLEIGTECYPYDSQEYPRLFVEFRRAETDEEERQRLEEEQVRKEHRRRSYEQLKKEFEP